MTAVGGPIDRVAAGWLDEVCTVVLYIPYTWVITQTLVLWAPKVLQQGLEHRRSTRAEHHFEPSFFTYGSCRGFLLLQQLDRDVLRGLATRSQ